MRKHVTHFDDCGCKSERYERTIKRLKAKIARLEGKGVPKYKKNTIEWWLSRLPKGIGEKALRNRMNANGYWATRETAFTLPLAILDAFHWEGSPEGHTYWYDVMKEASR